VFAGVSLQGSTLREDSGENKELYGKELTNREIVTGSVSAPAAASELMTLLKQY
jgi:lipid-binding SYLF domain-containing protein